MRSVRESDGPSIRQGVAGWRKHLDLNEDYVIEQTDADIIRLLADAHSGELTPATPEPRDGRLLRRSEATEPEPAHVPTTTPTQ